MIVSIIDADLQQTAVPAPSTEVLVPLVDTLPCSGRAAADCVATHGVNGHKASSIQASAIQSHRRIAERVDATEFYLARPRIGRAEM